MAQKMQKVGEIESDQWLENFIDRLSKISDEPKTNRTHLREKVKDLVEEGKKEIKQRKSRVSKQSAELQAMPTVDRSCRMEDKETEEPSEEEQKSGKKAPQVEEKQQSIFLLKEQLRICENDLAAKEREVKSLIERVARFSEMQTKRDQRNVEDTLSLNRPSIVERDFKHFKSDERVDALIAIKTHYKRETGVSPERLSCIIFEAIYEHMSQTKSLMVDSFKEISKFALLHGPWLERYFNQCGRQGRETSLTITIPLSGGGSDYPRDVLESFSLAAKESASNLLVEGLVDDYFLSKIIAICRQKEAGERSSSPIPWEQLLKHLNDYIKMLTGLTWRMVTQVPPLMLKYKTLTFTSQYHQMVGSDHEGKAENYRGKPVRYLWPGLEDGGGRVIALGEVTVL